VTSNPAIMPAGPAAEYQHTSEDVVTEQHLFFVGVDGQLIHSWYDGINTEYSWTSEALTQVNVSPGSDPIAMQLPTIGAAPNELHVFFRGIDGSLQHIWYDGSTWSPETIPGAAVAVPQLGMLGGSSGRALGGVVYQYDTESATDIAELDVFFCGIDGQLHERRFVSNQGWSSPDLPGPIAGPPTAQFWINPAGGGDVYAGTGDWQVNVFYTGTDGNLHQTYSNDGLTWATGITAGSPLGPPAAVGGAGLGIYPPQAVWYRGEGSIYRTWYDGAWQNEAIAGAVGGDPVATSNPSNAGFMKERGVWIYGDLTSLYTAWLNVSGPIDGPADGSDQPPGSPARILGVGAFSDGPHTFFAANNGTLQQTWGDDDNWSIMTTMPASSPPNPYPSPVTTGNGCNLLAAAIQRLRRRLTPTT
jgi:hypothetical protein